MSVAPETRAVLLRIPEACEVLSLSRSHLYKHIAAGRLKTVHIGRSVRIPVAALREFVIALGGDLDA